MTPKYRVKLKVVDTYDGFNERFVVQKRNFFGWFRVHEHDIKRRDEAEKLCDDLNAQYEKNHKSRIKDM